MAAGVAWGDSAMAPSTDSWTVGTSGARLEGEAEGVTVGDTDGETDGDGLGVGDGPAVSNRTNRLPGVVPTGISGN